MVATCFSPFNLNTFVNFNPINLTFGWIIRLMNFTYLANLGKIHPEGHALWTSKVSPFIPMAKSPIHFWRRELASTWHDTEEMSSPKFVASMYFWLHRGQICMVDWAILSMQNCLSSSIMIQLLKLLPLIIFLFPVLSHLYLGILEEYSLGILCTKLGKID